MRPKSFIFRCIGYKSAVTTECYLIRYVPQWTTGAKLAQGIHNAGNETHYGSVTLWESMDG